MVKKFQLVHFFVSMMESQVDVKVPQVMYSMLCYSKLVGHAILEPRTKLSKTLVSYFKSNGITTLKKMWT